MRIGTAWAKALLPVGLLLVAAATAKAQYAPYAAPGQPYSASGYPDAAAQYSQAPYMGGAGVQPIFYDQGGFGQPGGPPPGVMGQPAFEDPANGPGFGNPVDDGTIVPYLGQERAFGTGGITHPRWFDVSADYMLLTRDNASRFVPFTSDGPGGPIILSTNNLNMPSSSGFRVTGNYLIGPGRNLEGSFFGAFNYNASARVFNPAGGLFSPFSGFGAAPGFIETDDASVHSIAYSTNLNSAELNLRQRYVSPNGRVHTSMLVGVRYLSIDEDFLYTTTAPRGTLSYLTKTSNDLVGFQVGGDIMTAVLPRLKFGAEAKAGVYGNDCQLRNIIRTTAVGAAPELPDFTNEASNRNNCSFVGEAGAFTIIHVSPRVSLKAGYQCLVATGLALAPENFNSSPLIGARPVVVNVGGSAFYHGGQAGFEYTY